MAILTEIIKDKYPAITEMYFDYINTTEYCNLSFQKAQDGKAAEHIDEALKYYQSGKSGKAIDCLIGASVDYELSGFILGFTYAYNLLKEMESVKDFAKDSKA